MTNFDPNNLENLYNWLDSIPFSKKKKSLARDFSDGILAAQLIKYFFPSMVEIHNYAITSSVEKKKINWRTLSNKVLKKLGFPLSEATIKDLANSKREATEYFLITLRAKIDYYMKKQCAKQEKKTLVEEKLPSNDDQAKEHPRCMSSVDEDISPNIESLKVNDDGSIPYSLDKEWWNNLDGDISKVPRTAYEQKVQELLLSEETVHILQARIQRLEHTLQMKDVRIRCLEKKIEKLQYERM